MHLQLSKEGIKSSTTSPEGLHEDAQKNVTHLPKGPPKKAVFSISKSPAGFFKQSQKPNYNPSKPNTGKTKSLIMNATEDTSHSSVESYKQTSKVSPNSPTDTSENSRSSNDSTIVTQKAISKSPERVAEKNVNENGKTSDE